MNDGLARLYKFGGVALVAAGSLWVVKGILEFAIGTPPSAGTEILDWLEARQLPLAITNEVFFVAAGLLVPAVIALYCSLAASSRSLAAAGGGVVAATIPVLFLLAIVHGRLMYPVYDIKVHTPEIAEFTVAAYYGGLHSVAILLAIGAVLLSFAMRRGSYRRETAYLGFAAAGLQVLGSYPEVVGRAVVLVAGLALGAWFVAVGSRLYGLGGTGPLTTAQPGVVSVGDG